jgi:hypothetical protein
MLLFYRYCLGDLSIVHTLLQDSEVRLVYLHPQDASFDPYYYASDNAEMLKNQRA